MDTWMQYCRTLLLSARLVQFIIGHSLANWPNWCMLHREYGIEGVAYANFICSSGIVGCYWATHRPTSLGHIGKYSYLWSLSFLDTKQGSDLEAKKRWLFVKRFN